MNSRLLGFLIMMKILPQTMTTSCTPSINPCCNDPRNTFFMPSFNASVCVPVPMNAVLMTHRLGWSCVEGTVGRYGLRKYNLPCTSYSFSSTLGNAAPCAPYASASLSEGYTSFGWCVSCQIAGNCPGAWAQADLGLVGNIAGVYVSGRSGFCNFPLTLTAKSSMDGIVWTDVDGGNVFSTGMTRDHRCVMRGGSYMIQKPLSIIRFAEPLMARYIRVYPLTGTGYDVWNTFGAYHPWWMCMQFEPLAVSDAWSNVVVAYPFASASTLAQGFGTVPTTLIGTSNAAWTNALGGGLQLGVGQVVFSPFIDFSDFSEFTLTYWTSVTSFSCNPLSLSFGLLEESGRIFYGVAPCYGTSYMKITFDGTRSFNGFGWNQHPHGKNLQRLHGRRAGNTNFFWFGQGGHVDASNGMSGAYEIFNLPYWPGRMRFTFGSPGHRQIIRIHDVRLYRDSSLTGSDAGFSGRVPFDADPTPRYVHTMDSCAICQPGFYCTNNQVFPCPANSSAGFRATSITQCICTLGLFKDPELGCRPCRSGFYCPNQNTELPCSVGCNTGFVYQSAACTSSADRVCTLCPLTANALAGGTPAACICPANTYNNRTGLGCSPCPSHAVSPVNSFGLSACTCVSGFIASPLVDNATGTLLSLECRLCPPQTYSIANTMTCFPFPPNTVVSHRSPLGFFCPQGFYMPTDVPVTINASTGIPRRPGLLYWNFESRSFSVMRNEWGDYRPENGGAYTAPRIFPDSTTADIQALNPGVRCRFGTRCALIGGTVSSVYRYTFPIPSFPMPAAGISVSYWFRVNSCQNCPGYGLAQPTAGANAWTFAGVTARHNGFTSNLIFSYNGLSTATGGYEWSLLNNPMLEWESPQTKILFGGYDESMTAFRDKWHHHLFTFLPGGNFSGYLNGVLKARRLFNANFPSTVSGSFFIPNYYNGMVDDFAIFEGDVSPYLANFQTMPANQALDGTGIAAACIPCFIGMYCNNNTATTCPNNRTNSLPLSASETDCQCHVPGRSGFGNFTQCNDLCPANNYCLGAGFPTQKCPENRVSVVNSSLLAHCTCPLIFEEDASGYCGCPLQISNTIVNPAGVTECQCKPGFITLPALSFPYTGIFQCGMVGNSQCSHASFGPPIYVHNIWFPLFMFDNDLTTQMSIWRSRTTPASVLRIDMQLIYYITNISLPRRGTDPRATHSGFSIGISSTSNSSTAKYLDNSKMILSTNFYIFSEINSHARYIFFNFPSPNTNEAQTDIFELILSAFRPTCSYCQAGFFCPTNSSSASIICPAGHYCPFGSSAPIPCGFNMFSLPGASLCRACPSYIGITDTMTAASALQCRCPAGHAGNASISTISLPEHAFSVGPGRIIWEPWRKIHGKHLNTFHTPGNWAWNNYPSFDTVTCTTPIYIEYDLQGVFPLSRIHATPQGWGSGTCGLYLKLSLTGEFMGEDTTVFQCPTFNSCPPYASSTPIGYWINFPTQLARYIRFYLAGDTTSITSNFIYNFYVYQCIGPDCFGHCNPCPANFFCPGTAQNPVANPCPNTTYTNPNGIRNVLLRGATSVAECGCPANAGIMPGNTFCTCNAGFYFQQNLSEALRHVGWQCDPCPPNTTSLPGASNFSECFCSAGLNSVVASPMTDRLMTRFTGQSPHFLTITRNQEFNWAGDFNLLNDGIGDQSQHLNYPRVTNWVGACFTKSSWVQYDLRGIYPLTRIVAKPFIDSRQYCLFSLRVSATGNFSGEETTVFSCGQTQGSFCPIFPLIGHTANFPVINARFIRWFFGSTNLNSPPILLQLSVFYAVSRFNCISCLSNSYCPSHFINQTIRCPNNTFSLPGASSASQCVCPANAEVQGGASNCSCRSGYFMVPNATAPLNARWQCNLCPPNLMSPPGSTDVAQCVCIPGFYPTNPLVSLQVCSLCPENMYCPFRTRFPIACPAGTLSAAGAVDTCPIPCPPGFYCPGNTSVLPCPPGSYSTGGAKQACTLCEPGYFCNTTLTNEVCPRGFFCPPGTVEPVPCTISTYSMGGASQCTVCEGGYYCPTVFGRIQCPILHQCPVASTAPLPCEEGLYSCVGSTVCAIQCPPGGFCPGNGTVQSCPLGTFSTGGAGAAGCKACPEGFFCDFSLQLSAAGCE